VIALGRRDRVVSQVAATRLTARWREKSAKGVLRPGESVLCIPVYSHDQKERPMHATGTDIADLDDDLRLITLPEAARFLSISRGSLYDLLTTGQLASVHIGRSRRVPMGELRRYIRERLERDRRVNRSLHTY
jgi:excisionase family DNA binding protein